MKLPLRLTKQQIIKATSLSVVTALALSVVSPLVAAAAPRRSTNQDKSVTNTEVKQALQNTAGVLETSDQTKATADSTDALKAASAGATVRVPKDAKRGISITAKDNSSSLNVALPNAASAGEAQTVANGVVSYPSTTQGFANAVQTNEDGSVRMLTVIDNPSAPTKYSYALSVPTGGRLLLAIDGGVIITDSEKQVVATVDKPWAKDANGTSVQTWFTVTGTMLTQHIKHHVPGIAYPITADPRISWAWHGVTVYLTRSETYYLAIGAFGAIGGRFGTLGTFIGTGAGTAAADWARKRGYCVGFYHSWAMAPWYSQPFTFRC